MKTKIHYKKKLIIGFCVGLQLVNIPLIHSWSLFGGKKTIENEAKKDGTAALSFDIQGGAEQYSMLTTLMLSQGDAPLFLKFSKVVYDDLEFTDQFSLTWEKSQQDLALIQPKKLFERGTSLLFLIKYVGSVTYKNGVEEKLVQVTVKDTNSDSVVFTKKMGFTETNFIHKGHELASQLLEALTGEAGVCLSSLAFCKTLGPWHKVICVSDYACKKGMVVVPTKAVNVAPSWHTKVPVLFYSQLTRSNNRLMSIDLATKKHSIVCSYDGLNMQPSFSADGMRAVICLSGGKGNSELYMYDQRVCSKLGRRVFKPLTNNGAHNVSPCMLPDGNVIFCSSFETGQPQLYYMNVKKNEIQRLTDGSGYCAAPSYCAKTNSLIYVRQVGNSFQLFALCLDNMDRLKERQITFKDGDKHEPSWSECGRYVAFSMDQVEKDGKKVSQIAVLNFKSGKIRVLTSGPEPKSFPRWSGMPVSV